jgi:hypothetical protein
MEEMFAEAKSFNQNISNWHIKNNTNTTNMFDECLINEEYKPEK